VALQKYNAIFWQIKICSDMQSTGKVAASGSAVFHKLCSDGWFYLKKPVSF
jgi:hypothetical protein